MEKIIVGFSRPKKFKVFAWLIMKGFGTPYDHVYIKFHSNSYDRDIIYQASKMMINFMGNKLFEDENVVVKEFEVDITPENKKAMMQFAIDNAGKPYSMKEVLGLAWVKINSWFGRKIPNPLRDGNHAYVCSVIAGYILENYAGKDIPGDFEDMSPEDIYNYLSK